jgi:hypothetical protein
VARGWRELKFSQNLRPFGGSDRPDLKISSFYFIAPALRMRVTVLVMYCVAQGARTSSGMVGVQ